MADRTPPTRTMNESEAIDTIHGLLDGGEWSADTLDGIAEAIRNTGRIILPILLDRGPEFCRNCGTPIVQDEFGDWWHDAECPADSPCYDGNQGPTPPEGS